MCWGQVLPPPPPHGTAHVSHDHQPPSGPGCPGGEEGRAEGEAEGKGEGKRGRRRGEMKTRGRRDRKQ